MLSGKVSSMGAIEFSFQNCSGGNNKFSNSSNKSTGGGYFSQLNFPFSWMASPSRRIFPGFMVLIMSQWMALWLVPPHSL